MMIHRAKATLFAGVLGIGLAGCGGQEAAAPAVRVENPELGLAIAALPAAFTVAENKGETLRLAATGVDGGEAEITVGPVEPTGINLIEVVKERRAAFEAEGLYFGNRELITPTGPAFTARGQRPGAGGPIEETWIYSLHPDGSDRLLSVVYRYPGGGDQEATQARVSELLELVGELEPLAATGA